MLAYTSDIFKSESPNSGTCWPTGCWCQRLLYQHSKLLILSMPRLDTGGQKSGALLGFVFVCCFVWRNQGFKWKSSEGKVFAKLYLEFGPQWKHSCCSIESRTEREEKNRQEISSRTQGGWLKDVETNKDWMKGLFWCLSLSVQACLCRCGRKRFKWAVLWFVLLFILHFLRTRTESET